MSIFDTALEWGPIYRIRRNHALEHATLKILSKKHPGKKLAGYSDIRGFWLFGAVPTDDVQIAIEEALQRLRAGEHGLAVHPTCGTNFAVSGALAGTTAWIGMLGTGNNIRRKLDRWPLVVVFATMALIFSQPLGPKIQEKVTTCAKPGTLRIVEIIKMERNHMPVHRVVTDR